jgi:hypothetical protein
MVVAEITLPVTLSVLSLVVAICAFSVAARNFYLTRFQHVRCVIDSSMISDAEFPQGEMILTVEVESWGLPVWDTKVALEVLYEGDGAGIGKYACVFQPVGSLPNPLNAGQVAKFRLTRTRFRQGFAMAHRTKGVSDLPAERVYLCVYGSAERRITFYNRAMFGWTFSWFDSIDANLSSREAKRYDNWFKLTLFRIRQRILRQRPMTSEEYQHSRFKVLSRRHEREEAAAAAPPEDGSIGNAAKRVIASCRATGLTEGTRRVVRDAMGKVVRRAVSQSKLTLSKLQTKGTGER